MINGVVMFDYDGVIVDSLERFTQDFILACQDNGWWGLQSREDALAIFDINVYEAMKQQGVKMDTINSILKNYEVRSNKHEDDTPIFPGMTEALKELYSTNLVYIVTSNISASTAGVLERNNLTGFQEVLGADKEKNKVRKIHSILERHPGLPAVFIGDTIGDILEGKEAGVPTIGVAWGWHGAERLKTSEPDCIAYTPEELVTVVGTLARRATPHA